MAALGSGHRRVVNLSVSVVEKASKSGLSISSKVMEIARAYVKHSRQLMV